MQDKVEFGVPRKKMRRFKANLSPNPYYSERCSLGFKSYKEICRGYPIVLAEQDILVNGKVEKTQRYLHFDEVHEAIISIPEFIRQESNPEFTKFMEWTENAEEVLDNGREI